MGKPERSEFQGSDGDRYYFDVADDDALRQHLAVESGWPHRLDEEWTAHSMLMNEMTSPFNYDQPDPQPAVTPVPEQRKSPEQEAADLRRLNVLWTKSRAVGLDEGEYREITTLIFSAPTNPGAVCNPCMAVRASTGGDIEDGAPSHFEAVADTDHCKWHLRDGVMYRRAASGASRRSRIVRTLIWPSALDG